MAFGVNSNFNKIPPTGTPTAGFSPAANASQYGGMGNASIFGATQMADNNLEAYLDSFTPTQKSEPKQPSAFATAMMAALPAVVTTAATLGLTKLFSPKSGETKGKGGDAAPVSTKPQDFHMPKLDKASAGQLEAGIASADKAISANDKALSAIDGDRTKQEGVKEAATKTIDSLKNTAEALPEKITGLKDKLATAEAADPKDKGLIKSLKEEIKSQEAELEKAKKGIETAEKQMENADKALNKLKEKEDDLKAKNIEITGNKEKCEARLKEIKAKMGDEKTEGATTEDIKNTSSATTQSATGDAGNFSFQMRKLTSGGVSDIQIAMKDVQAEAHKMGMDVTIENGKIVSTQKTDNNVFLPNPNESNFGQITKDQINEMNLQKLQNIYDQKINN